MQFETRRIKQTLFTDPKENRDPPLGLRHALSQVPPSLSDNELIVIIPNNSKRDRAKTQLRTRCLQLKVLLSFGYPIFAIFTCLAVIVCIVTVCVVSRNKKPPPCKLTFKPMTQDMSSQNSNPRALAAGDFNNDSLLDIVVANWNTDSIGVSLGSGDGVLRKQVAYFAGENSKPYSVDVGDLNNDQRLDIAVANYGAHTVAIFFGSGNGSFELSVVLPTGVSRPLLVATADLNNDRHLDVIALNYGTNDFYVFSGYGNGSFSPPTTYSTGFDSIPNALVTVDLNHDGLLDIVIANYMGNSISVFLGRQNDSLADPATYALGSGTRPYSIVAGDFNNDSHSDVVLANSGTGSLTLLFGTGQGTFTRQQTITTSVTGPMYVAAGDFNKDTYLDIAVASNWNNRIVLIFGSDNGGFTRRRTYSTGYGSYPMSIIAADFNADERLDVAVINNGLNAIGIYLGYDSGVFQTQNIYSTGNSSNPKSLVTGDFNNDGRLDIVVGNNQGDSMSVLFGFGNGSFTSQTVYSTGSNSTPSFVDAADLNGDGLQDVVVALPKTDTIGIFFGSANGTFSSMQNISIGLGSTPRCVRVGDFNGDQCVDMVVGKYDMQSVGVFLGDCNGTFANQTEYATGSIMNPDVVVIADMNNDSNLDIIVVDSFANNLTIFFGYGNGTFRNQTTYSSKLGLGAASLTVADLNRDGKLDLVVAYSLTENIVVFFGNGNETFDREVSYANSLYSTSYSVAVGDINNDNISDIVTANYRSDNIGIMFGFPNGTFSAPTTYSTGTGSGPWALTLANVDNDERLDIVVTYSLSDDVAVLLGYDDGAFAPQAVYTTGSASQPVAVAINDFNRDQRLDLAIVNYGTGELDIRLQTSDGRYTHDNIYSTGSGSLPFDVVVADFNRDTILDIAVTNFGSNTLLIFYGYGNGTFMMKTVLSTGANSNPSTMAMIDLNGDTWLDLIVANSGSNTVSIFLGYQYPSFSTPVTYAIDLRSHPLMVIVGDFNNDQYLDIVSSTDGQASGSVFLGFGNGTFRLETVFSTPSFREAQLIASGYFNADECLDLVTVNVFQSLFTVFVGLCNGSFESRGIFLSENHTYPSSIVTGDFNKDGLSDVALTFGDFDTVDVFLNDGNNTFKNVTSYSTGLGSVPSALAKGDFDSDTFLDIVVTNYNASSVTIFFGSNNGTFNRSWTYSTGVNSRPGMIDVGDFNADRLLDILVVDMVNGQVGVLLALSNSTLANQTLYSVTLIDQPSSIGINDFNGDDCLDLIVTSLEKDTLRIYYGNGDGTFELETMYTAGDQAGPMSLAVGDFNGDQQQDVAVANYAASNIGVFLGYCCEPFLSQRTISTGSKSTPQSVVVGDFNQDNKTDLVVANSKSFTVGIFFGRGDGTFGNQTSFPTGDGSAPVSLAIGDLDNDGWSDILVANYLGGTIGIFHGRGNGTFAEMITYQISPSSRPSFIALVELSGSSSLDVFVTDHGTNAVYLLQNYNRGSFGSVSVFATGYRSLPYVVAIGDFDNDMALDVVVALAGTSNIGFISKTC